jgi:hypothetical protein
MVIRKLPSYREQVNPGNFGNDDVIIENIRNYLTGLSLKRELN